MELVKVSLEREFLLRPDAFQTLDELAAAAVPLGVVKPPLPDTRKLGLEPARDDVYCDAAIGVVVY